MSYLSEDDKKRSSMRYNNRIVTYAATGLMAVVAIYIIIMAVKNNGVGDWMGLAAFIGALATLLTGVYSAKAYQKKHE